MESTRFPSFPLPSSKSSSKNIELEFDFALCHGCYLYWHR